MWDTATRRELLALYEQGTLTESAKGIFEAEVEAGRLANAEAWVQLVLAQHPGQEEQRWCHEFLGNAYEKFGMLEKSREHLHKAGKSS